jgi:DegV family protein with EDD domain
LTNVGIVCDSNCDLPVEIIKKFDIKIVPARIIFGDEEVRRHYVDLSYEEFYHRLVHDKEMPRTSVPTPKEYLQVYEESLKKYDELIVFCTSSKLSSMYNSAQMIAKQFNKEKITVIDTQTTTFPMGIIVLETAKKAAEGVSKVELIKYVKDFLMPNTHAFGGIPTLTYLQKGGRIGKASSFIGNLLQVKPIISIENGELATLGKIRGMDNVYKLLFDFMSKMVKEQTVEIAIIGHTANLEAANKLKQEIQSLPNAPKNLQVIEMGPGVGSHLGPGGLLISWVGEFNKELLDL